MCDAFIVNVQYGIDFTDVILYYVERVLSQYWDCCAGPVALLHGRASPLQHRKRPPTLIKASDFDKYDY